MKVHLLGEYIMIVVQVHSFDFKSPRMLNAETRRFLLRERNITGRPI